MTDREVRPDRGRSRRAATVILAVAVVAIGIGLAIAMGGGLESSRPAASPGAGQAASPAFTDLPLVTVPPTTAPARASGSARPSAGATLAAAEAIRASRIRIARLGIDLAIIEGDGIDAPIGKVAHYPGSAWPGGGSNIYIYGHAREGMFISLWKARGGDEIALDLVDGTTRTYVVTKVLRKVSWDAVEYLGPTATEQLTLQTSTSYQPTAPRFIVIAVPAT